MKRLALLCLLSFAVPMVGKAQTFEPWSFTERDLFPSAIISTATVDWNGAVETAEDRKGPGDPRLKRNEIPIYGDENGWLAVALFDVQAKDRVRVEISVDGFMNPSVWEGVIKRSHAEVRIFPKATWDFEALHKVREQRPASASFKVTVNDKVLPVQTEVCTIRSLNDCPLYVVFDEEGTEFENYADVIAAYVNENHPWVDGILKEALDTGLIDSFDGFQSGDSDKVLAQVFAIWNALQKRGLKYSDISTTTPARYVFSQTVRFLDDSIEAAQANCVDGTVLMASILRKIGLEVHLALVPGHCLLAFDLGQEEDSGTVGLETTMLGTKDVAPKTADLMETPASLKGTPHEASFRTFAAALGVGTATLEQHAQGMTDDEEPATQLITVSAARQRGIMPIATGRAKK